MLCGDRAGAIVNLYFPNWLLALLWVLTMAASNIELLVSFIRYMRVKKEAASIAARLRLVSPPASGAGAAAAGAAAAAAGPLAGAGSIELMSADAVGGGRDSSSSPLTGGGGGPGQQLRQRDSSAGGDMSRGDMMRERVELLDRAQRLAKQAHKIEARALLYPTLYVPDVGKALKVGCCVCGGFGGGVFGQEGEGGGVCEIEGEGGGDACQQEGEGGGGACEGGEEGEGGDGDGDVGDVGFEVQ